MASSRPPNGGTPAATSKNRPNKKIIAPANQYERHTLTPNTVVTARAISAAGTKKASLPNRYGKTGRHRLADEATLRPRDQDEDQKDGHSEEGKGDDLLLAPGNGATGNGACDRARATAGAVARGACAPRPPPALVVA